MTWHRAQNFGRHRDIIVNWDAIVDGNLETGPVGIGGLVEEVAPISPADHCGDVHQRFVEVDDLLALAVVDTANIPVGMVNRHELQLRLADRFGWALFERKPIADLMDDRPFMVDAAVPFMTLSEMMVTQRPSALLSGFIVTQNGKYAGIGTTLAVLKMSVDLSTKRAEDLQQAHARAQDANHAKNLFLANMSHELRTPLNAIIGFSDVMKQRVFGALGSDFYEQYVHDINSSGHHLLELIEDILDISKVEAGKLEPTPEVIDLSETIQSCLRYFSVTAENADVDLILDIPDDRIYIRADKRMFRQILLNLVSNAVKFTDAGGTVTVSAESGPSEVKICIKDEGIGIAPENITKVMEPFGQVDSALNRRYDGTGLGLPLASALAKAQGGEFMLESMLGEGTTAAFTLPRATDEDREPVASDTVSRASSAG